MASSMARVYASACKRKNNPKNFNTVPAELSDEVRSIIENDGYVINEDGTVVKPDPENVAAKELSETE